MGVETHFRVWRKHSKVVAEQAEISKLKEEYIKEAERNSWTGKVSKADALPILLKKGFISKKELWPDSEKLAEAFGRDDRYLYSFLYTVWFGSSLSELRKHYGLSSASAASSSAFIPHEDIKSIVQAARYLLEADEYSDKLESILDNEFVEILGDEYPKWKLRNLKTDSIYVDKNSEDSYVVSFGDPQSDTENAEENASAEYILKKLECCLRNVLEIEAGYEDDEIVLEICQF